ncbi:hypothetical protein HX021_20855 [Sphingobacterium sp. N143]|uniref:hypothetical protein n=1 Tax=Sphingobacterium sp. N143 TaxID=2746727 RepID=UPI002577826A|nr:hypothetical protein [Sphingobacterium sp. N143]MDM1296740.1 hypothetical protein [Sphingobacterium sp. N143]
MKESILEKISDLVTKGVESEAECVYLLTQSRKYMEQQRIYAYPNLRMLINWTVHSKLDNAAVKEFLEDLNDFLVDSEVRGSHELSPFPELKNKLSFVTSLQKEMGDFLQSIGIDSLICTDNRKFRRFLEIFGHTVEDTPLVYKANPPLSHLSEVTFSRRQSVFSEGMPPSFSWKIKNGTKNVIRIHSNIIVIPFGAFEIYNEVFSFVTNDRGLD